MIVVDDVGVSGNYDRKVHVYIYISIFGELEIIIRIAL